MKTIYVFLIIVTLSFSQSFSVIVSKDVSYKLTKSEVKNIYASNQTSWESGDKIQLLMYSESKKMKLIYGKLYKNKRSFALKMLQRSLLSGKILPPKKFKSDKEIIEYVKNNKTSIGIIDSGSLNDDVREIIKL